jgi:hypothetical protein
MLQRSLIAPLIDLLPDPVNQGFGISRTSRAPSFKSQPTGQKKPDMSFERDHQPLLARFKAGTVPM